MSPVSGAEPKKNLEAWNKNDGLKGSHNCFSYAMNAIDDKMIKRCNETEDCDVGFHQPGYASGYGHFPEKHDKGCSNMVSRLWGDNPDVRPIKFHQQCFNGTSKIALIVDPKRDYHFVRQDSDGYWSHKPGAMEVTTEDASGRPIIRPDRALFIYKNNKDPLQYTKFCGYYCVPRGKPMYLMSDPRYEGGVRKSNSGNESFSFQKPIPRHVGRQTRRKSRGERHR
jgi:hypothetical protein